MASAEEIHQANEHDILAPSMSCEELSSPNHLTQNLTYNYDKEDEEDLWNLLWDQDSAENNSKNPDSKAIHATNCKNVPTTMNSNPKSKSKSKTNINTNTNTNTNSKSNFYPNPTPKPKPNLRHNLEPNSSNHTLTNVSSFSDDLFRQFDSSDTSDVMDDVENRCSLHQTSGKRKEPISKNLVSERKRRKKLNERLYSLRAIVPNISKMDKASIVRDAIAYVQGLQEEVKKIQTDIVDLQCKRDGGNTQKVHKIVDAEKKKTQQEHQIISLDVCQMDEHIYHIRIHCKKSPGILVQLTRALEALEIDILNANLTSLDDYMLNTVVVEVKNGLDTNTNELRDMALETVPKFGFFLI